MSAIEQARVLHREAREHKRAQQYHRDQARAAMEKLRLLCEEAGIAFEIVTKPTTDVGAFHGHRDGKETS